MEIIHQVFSCSLLFRITELNSIVCAGLVTCLHKFLVSLDTSRSPFDPCPFSCCFTLLYFSLHLYNSLYNTFYQSWNQNFFQLLYICWEYFRTNYSFFIPLVLLFHPLQLLPLFLHWSLHQLPMFLPGSIHPFCHQFPHTPYRCTHL